MRAGMGKSDLKRFVENREEASFWEQHFPSDELSTYAAHIYEGFIFALCSIRLWIMIFLTCLATVLCAPSFLNLDWDFDMDTVSVGTIVPLVFAIEAADESRASATKALGQMKARMMALYFQLKALDAHYGSDIAETVSRFSSDMGVAVIQAMVEDDVESSQVCYDLVSKLIEDTSPIMTEKYPPPVFTMISSLYQNVLLDFEFLRETRDSATPKGLRQFAIFLCFFSPITLAPFWLNFCDSAEDHGASHQYGCIAAYFLAIMYVLITFTLLRVQEALEDPFDGMGS